MTYSEKVATGLCTYRTCHAPHGIGRMCEGHAEVWIPKTTDTLDLLNFGEHLKALARQGAGKA